MADDIYIGGHQLKSPPVTPHWDTEDTRTGDVPAGGKLDVSNAPADPDKANGITPHPLQAHFSKKSGPVRKLGSPPVPVSQH
jgi:hypothetical protein